MHRCVIGEQHTRDELVPVVSLFTDKLGKRFFQCSIVSFPLAVSLWVVSRRNAMTCLKLLSQIVDDRVHKLSSLVANQHAHTAKAANNGIQKSCY